MTRSGASALGRRRSLAKLQSAGWVVLLALAVPALVLAQPRAGSSRERRLIDLVVVPSGDAKGDENVLATPLRRMGLEVRFLRSETFEPTLHAAPDVVARAYVDLRPTAQPVVLVLVDGPTGRVLVRRAVVREGSDEVVREQVALILESVVESALREANSASSAASSASSSSSAPASSAVAIAASASASGSFGVGASGSEISPPPPSKPLALHLDVAPFVSLHSLGSGAEPTVGGGLSFAAGARNTALSPSLSLMARFQGASVTDGRDTVLKTGVTSLRLLPMIEPVSTRRLSFQVGIGPGFDLIGAEVARGGGMPRRPSTSTSWVGSGWLQASFWITPDVAFFLAGMLDVDLTPHRFVVRTPGEPEVLIGAERVRKNLLLGLTFTVAGAGHE